MDPKLETILADIYALDPTLKECGPEVEALVAELLQARPVVAPDSAFVARLRARILKGGVAQPATSTQKGAQQSPVWMWWALRIAPVGVLALLMLVFIQPHSAIHQQPVFVPEAETPAPAESSPAPADVGVDMNTTIQETAPAAKMMTMPNTADDTTGGGAADASVVADTFSLKQSATSGDSLDIFEQIPGKTTTVSFVSLSTDGYVRVFAYTDGAVGESLGTSKLIAQGVSNDVVIPLSRAVDVGEVLYVQLFASDGDALYEPLEDLPVYDANGGFVYTLVGVSEKAGGETIKKGDTSLNKCTVEGGTWDAEFNECLGVGAAQCSNIGGVFDECASACRNDPTAQICTMQCVQVCRVQ